MKKLISIEWLRGAASFGVCEMHLFCALDLFSKNDTFFQKYIFPISIVGRVGVPVFFVISGFIIPYSMWHNNYKITDWFNFVLRRLIRLDPPYFVSIALVLITLFGVAHLAGISDFGVDWQAVLLHFGYVNIFFNKPWLPGVYWSLAVEFQYYLLIGLLLPLIAHSNPKIRIAALIIITSLGFYISRYITDNQSFIFLYTSFFIVGILTFQRFANLITLPTFIALLLPTLVLIYVQHSTAYCVFAAFTSLIISLNLDIKLKFVHFLGKISYSLYLIHWIVGVEFIRKVFLIFWQQPTQAEKFVVAIVGIIASVIAATLFYYLIELPSIKWGNTFKRYSQKKTKSVLL
jgi:peptidoglycan/LPS O-acetylase OafA/YrhL